MDEVWTAWGTWVLVALIVVLLLVVIIGLIVTWSSFGCVALASVVNRLGRCFGRGFSRKGVSNGLWWRRRTPGSGSVGLSPISDGASQHKPTIGSPTVLPTYEMSLKTPTYKSKASAINGANPYAGEIPSPAKATIAGSNPWQTIDYTRTFQSGPKAISNSSALAQTKHVSIGKSKTEKAQSQRNDAR